MTHNPMTMVERVARAIYEAYHLCEGHRPEFDGISWDTVCEMREKNNAARLIHAMATTEARAAIEAMRDPTEAMIEAGTDAKVPDGDSFYYPLEPAMADAAYRAMVKEALK